MMQMKHYPFMFEEKPDIADSSVHPADTHYVTSTTHADPPGTIFSLPQAIIIVFCKQHISSLDIPIRPQK